MKKFLVMLCSAILIFAISAPAFASGGDEYSFNIDEFGYTFEIMDVLDDDTLNNWTYLTLRSYNGNLCVDINELPQIPEGFYAYQLIEAANLDKAVAYYEWDEQKNEPDISKPVYYNWTPHLNEFIPVSHNGIYTYDSNEKINVKASFGGEYVPIEFPDQAPVVIYDRTLLPIRAIAEYFGWEVPWNEDDESVTVSNGEYIAEMHSYDYLIGLYDSYDSYSISHCSDTIWMDVPALIVNGRTFLPVRAVCESLGLDVSWNEAESCVYLTKK